MIWAAYNGVQTAIWGATGPLGRQAALSVAEFVGGLRAHHQACRELDIKQCIIRNNKESAYKALNNTEYMQSVRIVYCFICKVEAVGLHGPPSAVGTILSTHTSRNNERVISCIRRYLRPQHLSLDDGTPLNPSENLALHAKDKTPGRLVHIQA